MESDLQLFCSKMTTVLSAEKRCDCTSAMHGLGGPS